MGLNFHVALSWLVLVLATLNAMGAEPKRVLLIHSFGRDFSPYNTFSGVLRTEMAAQSPTPLDFFEVSLESARFNDPRAEGPLVDYLRARFAGHRMDLVVSIGGPATRFAQQHRQQLFPTTPMLIAATDQRRLVAGSLTTNDAVVAVANDPMATMETLLQVFPQTTNVAVVIGRSPLEQFWVGEIRREFARFTNRVALAWLNELPFPEMLKRCTVLPPRSAIYFPLLCVDAAEVPYLEEQALARLHDVANAPIFGIRETQLGRGIIGGRLISIEDASRLSAQVAVRILGGESPARITVPPREPGPPQFDWRELRRWGISEARLPADSVVLFRQPGLWERYWWLLCGGTLFGTVEAALIVGLLTNRAKRRQEEAVVALLADLSSTFVNLPPGEVDRTIEDAQGRICKCLGLDISTLWQWAPDDPENLIMTHIFRRFPGPPTPERFTAREHFPWALQQLKAGRVVALSMKKVPVEAARDLEAWRHFRLKTVLHLPLSVGGSPPIGLVAFNDTQADREWTHILVQRLRLLAQIFANALARKHADQQLRASEERLSMATAAADVGVWMWNIARNELWATPNWRRMFGFPPESLVRYEDVLDRVHPEDRATLDRALRHALAARVDFVNEHRVVFPDGTERWIGAHGRPDAAVGTQPLRMLGVSVDITHRKRAEQAARDFSGRLLRAHEEERARIAKELHDGLCQNLALLAVQLDMFGQRLPAAAERVSARLGEFSQQTKRLSAEVQRISRGLHPATLEQFGLAVAVEGLCREVEAAHGIAVRVQALDVPEQLSGELALCLYRVTQEAVQNVVKHSGARNARVDLKVVDEQIELTVTDDGRGFLVEPLQGSGSLGLASIRERVRSVHGEVTVVSQPGAGTRVEVRLPLVREHGTSARTEANKPTEL